MNHQGFYKFILPLQGDLFNENANSVDFEDVTKGRKGNHLVHLSDQGVPLVRTTTKYNKPAHNFSAIHHSIIEQIKVAANNHKAQLPTIAFNNALIEVYGKEYAKMKYHSDQCLDLQADSCIALFSCYEQPEELTEMALRKLKVRSKTTNEEMEFLLENNSVILFALSTNTMFQHKIVLENANQLQQENRWLGITFRHSKTFIQFKDNQPFFPNGKPLQLADEAQKAEFYKLRGKENKKLDFEYPEIDYTISISDTLEPIE